MASTVCRFSLQPGLMMFALIVLVLSPASIKVVAAANFTQSQSPDVKNLLLFRNSIDQDFNGIAAFSSWKASDVSPCQWRGVTCNSSVVSLSLTGLGLRGAIGSSLEQITTLHSLDLSDNRFFGAVPSNLSSSLRIVNLSGNKFSGGIPTNFFRPGPLNLQVLDLANNNLSGLFPDDILLRSTNLATLNVSYNQLRGSFPSLRFPASLQNLDLFQNNFSGSIPEDIGNKLMNLAVLNLGSNSLQGIIPSSIGNFSKLQVLVLEKNSLSGVIPPAIGRLTNLVQLNLGENRINGTLPVNLSDCSNLRLLHLQVNNLTGSIPVDLQSLKNLSSLNLQNNQLAGRIPPELGNCSGMTSINVAANSFGGGIPAELGYLTNLRELILHTNNLTGLIPPGIFASSNLQTVSISSNRLSGPIPGEVAFLPQLQFFNASGNRLQGQIPQQLGIHGPLTELDLSFNQLLEGSIPVSICSRGSLRILNLTGNNLTLGFPAFLNRSLQCGPSLVRLGLGFNDLGGEIPGPEIGLLSNVTVLDLSNNRFSGSIPAALRSLSKLEFLDLSVNGLSGTIPPELAGLRRLRFVNVSMNLLSGELPQSRAFTGSSVSSYEPGNPGLCGSPLGECLQTESKIDRASPAPSPLRSPARPGSTRIQRAWPLFAGAAIFGVVMTILLLSLMARSTNIGGKLKPSAAVSRRGGGPRRSRNANRKACRVLPHDHHVIELPVRIPTKGFKAGNSMARGLEEDLSEWFSRSIENPYSATMDDAVEQLFKEDHVIGRNKYSTLYRVAMSASENNYVIKKLKMDKDVLHAHQGRIMQELESLQKFSHKNIMRPIHFFVHNEKLLLLYKDSFALGTLHQLLDGSNSSNSMPSTMINPGTQAWEDNVFSSVSTDLQPADNPSREYSDHSTAGIVLDWDKRYQIAVGLALGIEELHRFEPPIVHLDISSSNIMIDEVFEPLVGDMELSRIVDPTKLQPEYIASFPGSTGYIAPEYAYTSRVTPYSNVYTYGVVLLEILTGRKPQDRAYGESYDLVKWVKGIASSQEDLLESVLDPQLQLHHASKHEVRQHMLYALRIALQCVQVLPSQRPKMKLVVEMLLNFFR